VFAAAAVITAATEASLSMGGCGGVLPRKIQIGRRFTIFL
jgi:hypothetical protein